MDTFFSSDNSSPGKEESNYCAMARINNAHARAHTHTHTHTHTHWNTTQS